MKLVVRMFVVTAFLLVVAGAETRGDETMYVKSKNAEVKSDPQGTAETVAVAPFGAEVTARRLQRRWWSVVYRGRQGWIFSGALSREQPPEDPSLRAADGSPLTSEEVDATSAVRGVGPTADRYSDANSVRPEHRMYLDYHQSFVQSDRVITDLPPNREVVTADDIEAFMREGKLGPYAE